MSDIERLAAVSFEMIVALMRESAARLTRAEAAEAKVATLTEALEKYGTHEWADQLEPVASGKAGGSLPNTRIRQGEEAAVALAGPSLLCSLPAAPGGGAPPPCPRCHGTGRERDGLDVDGKSWPCGLCNSGEPFERHCEDLGG